MEQLHALVSCNFFTDPGDAGGDFEILNQQAKQARIRVASSQETRTKLRHKARLFKFTRYLLLPQKSLTASKSAKL